MYLYIHGPNTSPLLPHPCVQHNTTTTQHNTLDIHDVGSCSLQPAPRIYIQQIAICVPEFTLTVLGTDFDPPVSKQYHLFASVGLNIPSVLYTIVAVSSSGSIRSFVYNAIAVGSLLIEWIEQLVGRYSINPGITSAPSYLSKSYARGTQVRSIPMPTNGLTRTIYLVLSSPQVHLGCISEAAQRSLVMLICAPTTFRESASLSTMYCHTNGSNAVSKVQSMVERIVLPSRRFVNGMGLGNQVRRLMTLTRLSNRSQHNRTTPHVANQPRECHQVSEGRTLQVAK